MIGSVWRVIWNGNDEPPNGVTILCEKFEYENSPYCRQRPPEIEAAYPGVGKGYIVTWQPVEEPPKQMPPEKLAEIRKKRLERRTKAKYPLFADQVIAEEIAKNPNYYSGITDPEIEANRQRIIQNEIDQIKRWTNQ